ncbi:hypothetical protein NQZ79_g7331 [Umbelopsis isabellina]|nr:hypothetical protein NQZ79_g7331 [Umbelopsis isabellina]
MHKSKSSDLATDYRIALLMVLTKYLVTSLAVLVGITMAFTNECDDSCDASLLQDCSQAVQHFEVNHIYEKSTSKSFNHCLATFQCSQTPYPDKVLDESSSDGQEVPRKLQCGELFCQGKGGTANWSQCLAIWSSYYRSKVAECARSTLGNVDVH